MAQTILCARTSGSAQEHLVDLLPDDAVAFAGEILERRAVDDVNLAAAVADHSRALQQAGRNGHRGPADAEHLPEKFLRQRDRIAVDAVARLQQPATKPRLERMQRIARDRLLDLSEQQVVVPDRELPDGLAFARYGVELGGREPACRARQLDDGAPDRAARAERRAAADDARPTERHGLDRGAVLHERNHRNHGAMRKIDLLDRAA